MSKSIFRNIWGFVKQTWYFHVVSVIIALTAIVSVKVLEMDKSDTENHSKDSENQFQSQSMINKAFADSYNLDVEGIEAISCTAIGFLDHSLNQDCAIMTI